MWDYWYRGLCFQGISPLVSHLSTNKLTVWEEKLWRTMRSVPEPGQKPLRHKFMVQLSHSSNLQEKIDLWCTVSNLPFYFLVFFWKIHLISCHPLPSSPSLLSPTASSTSPAGYCMPTSSLLPIVGQQWQARPQPQGLKPGSFGESPVWVVFWGRRDVLACERLTMVAASRGGKLEGPRKNRSHPD